MQSQERPSPSTPFKSDQKTLSQKMRNVLKRMQTKIPIFFSYNKIFILSFRDLDEPGGFRGTGPHNTTFF